MAYESFVAEIEEAILIFDQIWGNEPDAPGKGGGRMGYRFGQGTKKTGSVSAKDKNSAKFNHDMIERQFEAVKNTPLERAFFRLDSSGKVMSIWAFDPEALTDELADIWNSGDPTNADSLIKPSQNGAVGRYIFKQDAKGTGSLLWDMADYREVYTANGDRLKDADDIAEEIEPADNLDWGSAPETPERIGAKGSESTIGRKEVPVTDPTIGTDDQDHDLGGEEEPVAGEG